MIGVMSKMNKRMDLMNKNVNIGNINKVVENFAMNLEKQDMMGEMISDAMDDDEELVEDQEVNQYLDRVEDRLGLKENKDLNQDKDLDDMIGNLKK